MKCGDTIVDFIGTFSLTYNFGKGAFHKISTEISIPVLIVSQLSLNQ